MPEVDVIVLGAGPAGAAAAVAARGAGLSVALIDKAAFPRDKLCGGGLTGRAMATMARVFGTGPDPDETLLTRHVRLVSGGRVLGDFPDAPGFGMVMRRHFDAGLKARAVGAGATDLTGCRVASIEAETRRVRLASGAEWSARVLIGADGANSAVARALYGRAFDPRSVAFALEAEAPVRPGAALEIDLAAAHWGYGWVFPKRGSLTVGVGGVEVRNPDLKGAMAAYLARHGAAGLRCKGAFIPSGAARSGRGPVLLAGDAAGLCDPITGEGLAWAMESGALAGRAAAADDPGRAYAMALAPVAAELRRAQRLARIVHHPWLRPRFHALLARQPGLQRRFLQLLAGERDYADIGFRSLARLATGLLRKG